jgi:hypothetical protein
MWWVVSVTPRPLYPLERPGTHCMGVGGPQDRYGWMRKLSPSPRFDPLTVQPVASRYNDWAILAHNRNEYQEYSLGVKVAVCYGWQPYELNVPTVLKSGSLEPWNPQGLSRPVMGLFYLHVSFSLLQVFFQYVILVHFLYITCTGRRHVLKPRQQPAAQCHIGDS